MLTAMYTQTVEGTLTTPEVARATGLSYRQLDYWVRHKVIPWEWVDNAVGGSGSHRRWHPDAVEPLQVVGRIANVMPRGMNLSASVVNRILRNHTAGGIHLGDNIHLTW